MQDLDLKTAWAVLNAKWRTDSVNGGNMLNIEFINLKTRITAETYICPTHRNWEYWRDVTANLDQGIILGNLKIKNTRGWTGINADSKPEILWQGTNQKLADILDKIWNPPTKFQELFQ